jgi:hypothetical protein
MNDMNGYTRFMHIYKIGFMIGFSRWIGEEVAKIANVEEVLEAGGFTSIRHLRVREEVVDVAGVADVGSRT